MTSVICNYRTFLLACHRPVYRSWNSTIWRNEKKGWQNQKCINFSVSELVWLTQNWAKKGFQIKYLSLNHSNVVLTSELFRAFFVCKTKTRTTHELNKKQIKSSYRNPDKLNHSFACFWMCFMFHFLIIACECISCLLGWAHSNSALKSVRNITIGLSKYLFHFKIPISDLLQAC